ncbi:PREDICTED: uncharacterized protein LOC104801985 isoform X2 [Tarenaya hassleriana]|uniref:uncharacterized protein LOC104801985 isoform X2 n=1 Tax=Tarenaya hassleriana TaxID=28532 RepID=UPI00053C809F|nr:PREDICTED: uncharacterized protein LOC104801985 isoform X2 [Tarenaya hassleriana]
MQPLRRTWFTRAGKAAETAIDGEDMEEAEILELYELSYMDLVLLSHPEKALSSSSPGDRKKHQLISRDVLEALGPTGPGLLCITGVPRAAVLRHRLLPLARKLALLDPDTRKRILKEHHLGSDVPLKNPDRNVSSFSAQLKYAQSSDKFCHEVSTNPDLQEDEFTNLEGAFKELGFCMMEMGLCIARVCDGEIGGRELEDSLLESCTAKGRLIHYHSAADKLLLRDALRRTRSMRQKMSRKHEGIYLDLWQQWHYDYGIFTVLTDPMFLSSSSLSKAGAVQCGHTYLKIYHPSENKVYLVKSPPPDSFIVQVGESADVLSKGKLRSTLHCVCRPEKLDHVSRETFAVFLQPSWSKTFSYSDYVMDHIKLDSQLKASDLRREIQKIVPPLSSRLKDGMTFAEFARQTTKQYYGGSGLQST